MLQAFILHCSKRAAPLAVISWAWSCASHKLLEASWRITQFFIERVADGSVFHKLVPKCSKGAESCLSKPIFQCKTHRTSRAMNRKLWVQQGLFWWRAQLFHHGSALAQTASRCRLICFSMLFLLLRGDLHSTNNTWTYQGLSKSRPPKKSSCRKRYRLLPLKSSSICEKVHSFLAIGGLASKAKKQSNTEKKNGCGMLESGLILSLLCQDIG